MRLALLVQVAATALLLCGCPGADEGAVGSGNTTDGSGASNQGGAGQGGAGQGGAGQGGAGQGGAGQGGAGQGGAGQGGAGQGGAGGGMSAACQMLESDVNVKLEAAQKCNPAIDVVQCVDVVQGLCCDTIVGTKDSPDVQAYLEALKQYQAASCNPTCPPIPCPAAPSGTCKPSGSGLGQCMLQP